tara:strand:+ start:7400 stop:9046 length:1647 start_codon:yes stop_codon:yes gene_type:complete
MCGILGLFNSGKLTDFDLKLIFELFKNGSDRGPDNHKFINYENDNMVLGFHRLSINGLNDDSNQPFFINNKILLCNGEIYNFKHLYQKYDITPNTDSDCEVIIHLYEMFGFDKMIKMIDGVFSFILIDINDKDNAKMYVSRDPFGVRPLYKCVKDTHEFAFTSTLRQLYSTKYNCEQFTPGTWERYYRFEGKWLFDKSSTYFNHNKFPINQDIDESLALNIIYNSLNSAVKKRVENTDRPIACLLSGGLDSSLITSLVCKHYQTEEKKLETYSIGLEGSVDIEYARIVAEFLGTKHTEVIVTEREFLDNIPKVIYHIESYDTTTVRASVGNFLISKYISENSNAKVLFNGDGSDEVCGGYLYFHKAPNNAEFDKECKRLLKDISYFDVLRSDRCISSNGLEARTPFLDKEFVENYLSIPIELRNHVNSNKCEKYLLRKAFTDRSHTYLPHSVLWRTKEAFSDGVSSNNKSWFQIIKDEVEKPDFEIGLPHDDNKEYDWNSPKTPEMRYYRNIFDFYYGDKDTLIPYFWMPKFVEANDSSARTLDIYKN